ncbi:hypothetical protein PC9H_004268 [Pleurotus ostreatus]|uniref:Uncharacterized protein n=1 Tax=Pleurotus ostreatus TaxID=5322 RepID=A0A8H7A2Z6_PLEOS|nr:uncharacterized protein PC9H_004268 [Pleurotus ostreatus]KAF7437429.1 hypothetical protein PC9H_004268 [Pleurotus ostreatus]KAJ8703357.1 hypothetical protein PTI98_001984 [Pleurotus ostreatus]
MSYFPTINHPYYNRRVGVFSIEDPNKPLQVYLVVNPRYQQGYPAAKDVQWLFAWDMGVNKDGDLIQRRLELDSGFDSLSNNGPITWTVSKAEKASSISVAIPLKVMSLAQRKSLETIAVAAKVKTPGAACNSQNWCEEVMDQAQKKGLLTSQEIKTASDAARRVAVPKK